MSLHNRRPDRPGRLSTRHNSSKKIKDIKPSKTLKYVKPSKSHTKPIKQEEAANTIAAHRIAPSKGRKYTSDDVRTTDQWQTPIHIARGLFNKITVTPSARNQMVFVDPFAGLGTLLIAAQERWPNNPDVHVLGYELAEYKTVPANVKSFIQSPVNAFELTQHKILRDARGLLRFPDQEFGITIVTNPPYSNPMLYIEFVLELNLPVMSLIPDFFLASVHRGITIRKKIGSDGLTFILPDGCISFTDPNDPNRKGGRFQRYTQWMCFNCRHLFNGKGVLFLEE